MYVTRREIRQDMTRDVISAWSRDFGCSQDVVDRIITAWLYPNLIPLWEFNPQLVFAVINRLHLWYEYGNETQYKHTVNELFQVEPIKKFDTWHIDRVVKSLPIVWYGLVIPEIRRYPFVCANQKILEVIRVDETRFRVSLQVNRNCYDIWTAVSRLVELMSGRETSADNPCVTSDIKIDDAMICSRHVIARELSIRSVKWLKGALAN